MRKLDIEDVKNATWRQKDRIQSISKLALQYLTDPDKKIRREVSECVCCFYSSKIGGSAITETHCRICDASMIFSSTCTDYLCPKCAAETGLCKCCGAGLELKVSKSLRLE